MDQFDEFMNQFLDEFVEWRKKKGYEDWTMLIQSSNKDEVEARFWQEMEEFKKEKME